MCMKRKIRADLLEQVKALNEARAKEKNELEARIAEAVKELDGLKERLSALGGIEEAEGAAAKIAEWKEKIETLSPTIRATVKALLGLE